MPSAAADDDHTAPLTDLGRALERARESLGLSKREAARRASISEGRWRQIVTGTQKAGEVTIAVNPRRNTVTAMATAVGFDPETALRLAGMEPMRQGETADGPQPLDPDVRRWMAILADPDVPADQQRLMREQMRIWDAQIQAAKARGDRPRAAGA